MCALKSNLLLPLCELLFLLLENTQFRCCFQCSGFKEEVSGSGNSEGFPEFGVVQDADRLDAIGAIGIFSNYLCFSFRVGLVQKLLRY